MKDNRKFRNILKFLKLDHRIYKNIHDKLRNICVSPRNILDVKCEVRNQVICLLFTLNKEICSTNRWIYMKYSRNTADLKWNMKNVKSITKYIRNYNCKKNKSFEFQLNPEIFTIYSYDFYGGDYNRATTALKSFYGLRPQKSSRRSFIFSLDVCFVGLFWGSPMPFIGYLHN